MKIDYPTALYDPILPSGSTPGNVTYTISNNPPPKSLGSFLQLPRNEEIKKQPERVWSKYDKRKFASNLIFNITIPSSATDGNGTKNFEIGQFLDFTEDPENNPDPYQLKSIELRQDTNVVDYKKYGLNDDEYNNIVKTAEKKMNDISNSINDIGYKLNNNKELISTNQANINESSRLYDNIVLIFGVDNEQAKKVKSKIEYYEQEKISLLNDRNKMLEELDSLTNDLSKVREVVR